MSEIRKNNKSMRSKLLLLFSFFVTMTMMAGPVTKDEAAQKAQAFINGKNKQRPGGPRRVKLAHRQMKLVQAAQENALYYVFNVGEEDGFVIVSGDDRTPAVLGYTDSGSFSTNQMPDNMRAWLQGYADQIAWLQAHPEVENEVFLAGTPVKQPIEPLVATVWNQNSPYNDLCPEYATGEKSATGCVATAMAQVMKYHEWPQAQTSAVPGYDKDYSNSSCIPVAALPATTFSWDMVDDYRAGYSSAQGTAVATLMQYCGASLKMNYGEQSGTNTALVAGALKDYFDYASTTTYKDRSYYSYANWIELLYNELAQGRPMVYSGQSSGGGHAFVCDGYEGEDYFHINWGWGGMSDGYFKLSALNPNEQGIGGSSSQDGYHFGQGAVVGIQKNGDTGTVLDVAQNNFSLSLQSITLSSNSITLGETVDVTFRVKNNGSDDYSGDLWVYANGLRTGKTFNIAAGETKDCVISYTPSGFTGTVYIQAWKPTGTGYYTPLSNTSKTLTISSGSSGTNNVTLTLSNAVVENTTLRSGNNYNLYGDKFNATVRVSNETGTDYDGTFLWVLIPAGERAVVNDISMKVPANSHVDIPISVNNLDRNKNYYQLQTSYVKNGSYSWIFNGNYYPAAVIMTYSKDGESNFTIPSGTSYDAATNAPEAVAIDITGTSITSITPNSLANTVYIYSGTKPNGLDGKNVVKNSNGNYTAETITLTDNNGFYSPVDFMAAKVEFNYDFTVAADGTNGWNTLVLPFKAGKVTADDAEIDWFRSSTDKGKNFWLKSFASDESTQVYFDFVEEIQANTPYIVAFPGNRWGRKWDMSNKTIKFIGENVEVSRGGAITSTTGSYYRFVGNTVHDNTANIYSLNEDGNLFVLNASAGSAPFRAFFKPGIFDASVTSLSLGSVTGGTTSIGDLPSIIDFESDVWYSIDGRRLSGKPTQKGVYIKNGKKTIIK